MGKKEFLYVCMCVSYLKISKVALSRETHWIAHFAFLVKMSTLLKPGVERGKLSFFLSLLEKDIIYYSFQEEIVLGGI